MIEVAGQGINPFERDTISRNFAGLYPELSFSAVMEDGDTDPFVRAAKIVCAALEYKDSGPHPGAGAADAGCIERRDSHLFGRVVSLTKGKGGWRKQIHDYPASDYIVVVTRGQYFALPVYDDGVPIGWERLAATLRRLAAQAANETPQRGYGALTAVVNTKTIALLHASETAAEPVRIIDAALFLLALDLDAAPEDVNSVGQQVHIAGYQNRDYRKSLQLVVLGNGKAGAVFNLFSGVEGVTAAQFVSAIVRGAATIPDAGGNRGEMPFTHIDVPVEPSLVSRAETRIRKALCPTPVVHRIDTMSKTRIKELGVSPDAFFHAAAHLAYLRRFGRTPEAHNFIDLRMRRYGSISRYPSTTDAMRSFLRSRTRADLLRALAAHKDAIADVRAGNHPLHYVYHYLFASPGIAAMIALALFALFVPRFQARFLSPDLWLSNIPALPGLVCTCRLGLTLSFLRKHAYTGHYMLFPDSIRVCFTSRDEQGVREWNIREELESAFRTLEAILSTPS